MASPAAIGVHEFLHSFAKCVPRNEKPRTVGLALSGGVDSMALAFLWQRHMRLVGGFKSKGRDSRPYAFIVDHRARPESTKEAELVARRVENRLGLRSKIITLDWDPASGSSSRSNFESLARHLRYRALGLACREHGIDSLLLAHHEDDDAETVLMRLATGHVGRALRGIRSHANIPECSDLYGVREGGNEPRAPLPSSIPRSGPTAGGVKILRPLLSFPKDRLIKTCQDARLEWVEDETNKDPTLTPRNAARILLGSGALPVALRKPSLLALSARIRARDDEVQPLVEQLYQACPTKNLDVRSGTLSLSIPSWQSAFGHDRAVSIEQKHRTYALLLQRAMQAVSPQEAIPLRDLAVVTCDILSIVEQQGQTAGDPTVPAVKRSASTFTKAKVLIRAIAPEPKPRRGREEEPQPAPLLWEFSRQRFHANEAVPLIPVDRMSLKAEFQLWDGRFWIRVKNRSPIDLVVRPFREGDVRDLKEHMQKIERAVFLWALRKTADPSKRATLPVIAVRDDVEPADDEGRIVAVPTFGMTMQKWKPMVRYRVQYKRVDL